MQPDKTWKIVLLVAIVVGLTLRLGHLDLMYEEPRRAEVAMEMVLNNNYLVPTINNAYYYNKPPLFNWFVAAAIKWLPGDIEFRVRVITIISFLGLGLLTFLFSRKFIGSEKAWLAGFFVLTSTDILFRFSLLGEIDVFYALIVTLQVFSIFYFWKRGNYFLLFTISYFFCAIGFLTKGLTSPAFQVFTLIGWALAFRKIHSLFSWQHIAGIILFLGTLCAYFIPYNSQNDALPFLVNLFSESTNRTGGGIGKTVTSMATFPFMLASVFLPWILLIFLFDKSAWARAIRNPTIKFSLVFIVANILIYWVSSGSRPRYLYPFIPFLAIICSHAWVDRKDNSTVAKYLEFLWIGLTGVMCLSLFLILFVDVPEAVEKPQLLSILFFPLFAILLRRMIVIPKLRIWYFLGVLAVARILFDFSYIPARKAAHEIDRPYKAIVTRLLDEQQGAKVYVETSVASKKLNPSLFDWSLFNGEILVPDWPGYQLSFYYAYMTNEIMSLDNSRTPGNLYLIDQQYVSNNSNIDVISSFYIPNKSRTYLLIKYLE